MTKSKQTREQWLDKRDIFDAELREATMSNFATRDELQAYITKMQRPGFASGDPFDIDDLLRLPRLFGAAPSILMEWKEAVVHEGALIDVFTKSGEAWTAEVESIKSALAAFISAGVPPEYAENHQGRSLGWSDETVLITWQAGLSLDDIRAGLFAPQYKDRDWSDSDTVISDAILFRGMGLRFDYLRDVPQSLTRHFVLSAFSLGADADAVKNRFESDTEATEDNVLNEIESMSAEYWNLVYRPSPERAP